MYNKFVFLYTSNFTARVKDFFCLSEWVANEYDVEYWDLSDITVHEKLVECNLDGLKIRKVKSIDDFQFYITECTQFHTLYLTWVNYCWYSARFYEVLSKNRCHYAFFDNGLIPPILSTPIKIDHDIAWYISKIKRITYAKIKLVLRDKFYSYRKKTKALKPADFYFRLSESYDSGADKVDCNTKIGWCNSGDFERNRQIPINTTDNYIVFLDQYLPYHSDCVLSNEKSLSPLEYYTSLNSFFSCVEAFWGIPVVIAAHPSANKYREKNPFAGRKIYYDQTAELVKASTLVLAHYTTAISYVVINKKPMILLTSNMIHEKRPLIYSYIRNIGLLLGSKCINVDSSDLENLALDEMIDLIKYSNYKYSYLTNHFSEKVSNFQNIINVVNSN